MEFPIIISIISVIITIVMFLTNFITNRNDRKDNKIDKIIDEISDLEKQVCIIEEKIKNMDDNEDDIGEVKLLMNEIKKELLISNFLKGSGTNER